MRQLTMTFDNMGELLIVTRSPENTAFFNIGKLGTALASILNADYRPISRTVRSYNLADGAIDTFDVINEILINGEPPNPDFWPPNYKLVYQQLISHNPILAYFYDAEDWVDLIYDFYDGPICGGSDSNSGSDIASFKEFLEVAKELPQLYSYDFIEYLNDRGLLPPFPIDPPAISREKKSYISHGSIPSEPASAFFSALYSQYLKEDSAFHGVGYSYTFVGRGCLGFVLAASLLEITRSGKIIRKCQNCGRYFVPENRSDTLYCDNPSPLDSTRTCKEYGSHRLWYDRQKDDELATLSRNILSAKSMLAKRNPDIEDYQLSYDYFRNERKKWKKSVEKGEATRDEYREWLLRMQSQKIIKEAKDGNS